MNVYVAEHLCDHEIIGIFQSLGGAENAVLDEVDFRYTDRDQEAEEGDKVRVWAGVGHCSYQVRCIEVKP